jgi:hypothetical protein
MQRFLKGTNNVMNDSLKGFLSSNTSQAFQMKKEFMPDDLNYNKFVKFVGTAHFSERSFSDVVEALNSPNTIAACLELCSYRYEYLKNLCNTCLLKNSCSKKCEFVIAVDTFYLSKIDVWLLDWTQEEIAAQILTRASQKEASSWRRVEDYIAQTEAYGLTLWEEGLKEEALRLFNGDLTIMKETFPTLWKVLFSERNLLLASRLIFVVVEYLKQGLDDFEVVALIGATHVEAIKEKLKKPMDVFASLEEMGTTFTPPLLVD